MYFVFEDAITTWQNSIVKATPRETIPYHLIKPHWWFAQPLLNSLPRLQYIINSRSPKPDVFWTAGALDLYSTRLIKIVRDTGINFESFPVTMVEQKTGEPLALQYELFHLLEIYPALDMSASEIDDYTHKIYKLVLSEKYLTSGKLLFRVSQHKRLVLIHENLKKIFDEVKITGCQYTALENYQSL